MKAIDIIYNNLKDGKIYATYLDNVRFHGYWYNLTYDHVKNLFLWRNFGSSANKATKKDLAWIIETIFKCSAEEFMQRYECVTREEYNKI